MSLLLKNNNNITYNKYTNLSYCIINDNFMFSNDKNKNFIDLYIEAINNIINNLLIFKNFNKYALFFIEIDLEIFSANYKGNRLYNNNLILNISKKFIENIQLYLDNNLNDKSYKNYIYNLNNKEFTYNCCIHIIYPLISTTIKINHLIKIKHNYKIKSMSCLSNKIKHNNYKIKSMSCLSNKIKHNKIFYDKLKIIYNYNKKKIYNIKTGDVIHIKSLKNKNYFNYKIALFLFFICISYILKLMIYFNNVKY